MCVFVVYYFYVLV